MVEEKGVQEDSPSDKKVIDFAIDLGIDQSIKINVKTPPLISCPDSYRAILGHLYAGWSVKTIMEQMHFSLSTMRTYLSRMRGLQYIDRNNKVLIDLKRLKVPQEGLSNQKTLVGYESSTGNEGVGDLKRTSISTGAIAAKRDVAPIRTAICKLKFELLDRPHSLILAGWQKVGLRNNEQFHTWFEGMYLMLTTKHLLVELPALDVQDAGDSIALAAKVAPVLAEELERQFGGLKLRPVSNGVQIVSPRHYAFQDHPFAQWLLAKKITWNSGSIHVDASKPDMKPEMEITDEEVKLSPEVHADAYKRHVIDQMQPDTPLVSSLQSQVNSLAIELQQMRGAMNDCAAMLKSTVDVQKLTAEQLQRATKLLLPGIPEAPRVGERIYYAG